VSDEKLLDAKQIAALFGCKSHMFAHDKMKVDPAFPKPVVTASSVGLCKMGKKFLWRREDIEAWQKLDDQRKKDAAGLRLGRNGKVIKREQRMQAFAGETAVQFIIGLFDPAFAQKQRLRRIERARKNQVKNQKRIHLEGDWK
jgi:predicted DNA-binding transcriptional regulator AlpA